MAKAKPQPKPDETTVNLSEATWMRIILTNLGKFAGVLLTIGVAIWQFGQSVESRITKNTDEIRRVDETRAAEVKQINEQLSAYREWNKEIGKNVRELESSVAFIKGATGMPRSTSGGNSYGSPPKASSESK